jgi:carbon monoxide dehydrogenase subunit G
MNFKGTVTINAPREKVWKFLTTPEQLTECAPGLESLEELAEHLGGLSERR